MEYVVFDERYHWEGLEAERYFACNDFDEAKDVANQIGVWFVVVRVDPYTGDRRPVFDAEDNGELGLAP